MLKMRFFYLSLKLLSVLFSFVLKGIGLVLIPQVLVISEFLGTWVSFVRGFT